MSKSGHLSRDSQFKESTSMKDRRILEEGEYEFGIENGWYVVTHKHKVEDCHYPYTMITVRYYHHKRRTCLECKKPLPKHLLFLRELMQENE
jgi:hypothetical protein